MMRTTCRWQTAPTDVAAYTAPSQRRSSNATLIISNSRQSRCSAMVGCWCKAGRGRCAGAAAAVDVSAAQRAADGAIPDIGFHADHAWSHEGSPLKARLRLVAPSCERQRRSGRQ